MKKIKMFNQMVEFEDFVNRQDSNFNNKRRIK